MRGTRASEGPEVVTVEAARAAGRAPGPIDEQPVLGRYVLGRRLGAGGFGTVYEAEDLRLGRTVAIKVIDGTAASPERARREAMAAARLDHPGIVAVFDAGESGTTRYLVSELVRGRTLAELEAAGALSDRDVLRIGLALADALGHAHARGVVHRDVKPHNVIVPEAAGEADADRSWRAAAKLADFGIASLADDEPLTQTGDIVGTLAYMAPEQAAGLNVDEQADVYALALVLYEALAGVHPVRAGSPAATARRVGTVLPSLRGHRGDLPREVCEAIDAALAAEPELRGGLDDLADALADALPEVSDAGGTIAHHPLEHAPLGLPAGSGRALSGLAAGGLVALGLGGLAAPGALEPLPAAAAIVVLTALAPRLGWLAGAALVLAALVAGPAPEAGTALLVAILVVGPPLLLRADGIAWSVPALAPLLGTLALAPAFPALAGRAPTLGARAALGGLGALWLLIVEPLVQRTLLFGALGASHPSGFRESPGATVEHVLAPLSASGAAGLIVLWASAAALLPWVVRGRSRGLDLAAAILWAGGLAAATAFLGTWIDGGVAGPQPRGLVVGAFAGLIIAAWRRR